MCKGLSEVLASARASVSSMDVPSLTAAEAANTFESFAELERLAVAGKLMVAPKIAQSDAWARAGHRTAEEWMARASGTSLGVAKATAETAKRVAELPATAEALRSGALSLSQAAAVSEAAVAAPGTEAELLELARSETVKTLQERARRVVLDSRGSVEERYEPAQVALVLHLDRRRGHDRRTLPAHAGCRRGVGQPDQGRSRPPLPEGPQGRTTGEPRELRGGRLGGIGHRARVRGRSHQVQGDRGGGSGVTRVAPTRNGRPGCR